MMKKTALIHVLLLCSTYSFCTDEINKSTTVEPTTEQSQNPDPSLLDSFSEFVEMFIFVLSHEKIQNGIKNLEEVVTKLIQTAFQVIQNSKFKENEIITRSEFIGVEMQDEMAETVSQQAKRVAIAEYNSDQKETDKKQNDNDDQVLAKFASIAQHFFNIVKDPENSSNVAPNLIGMLEGIVSIGAEVMKRSNLTPDSDLHDIAAYVAQLNDDMKQDMLSVIIKRKKQSDIATAA